MADISSEVQNYIMEAAHEVIEGGRTTRGLSLVCTARQIAAFVMLVRVAKEGARSDEDALLRLKHYRSDVIRLFGPAVAPEQTFEASLGELQPIIRELRQWAVASNVQAVSALPISQPKATVVVYSAPKPGSHSRSTADSRGPGRAGTSPHETQLDYARAVSHRLSASVGQSPLFVRVHQQPVAPKDDQQIRQAAHDPRAVSAQTRPSAPAERLIHTL